MTWEGTVSHMDSSMLYVPEFTLLVVLVVLAPQDNTENVVYKEVLGWITYIDFNVDELLCYHSVIMI